MVECRQSYVDEMLTSVTPDRLAISRASVLKWDLHMIKCYMTLTNRSFVHPDGIDESRKLCGALWSIESM